MQSKRYLLYLDECGDQNLATFDPQFPVFTLCGVVVSAEADERMSEMVNALKSDIWNNTNIIFHSRDIRKHQNGFEVLFDLEVKRKFIYAINDIMTKSDFSIICCSIKKEDYIRKYGRLNDVYALSLSYIMERTIFFLEAQRTPNPELNVVIEKRGKKEDHSLLSYYNQLLDKGTYWVDGERMKRYAKRFDMRWKSENIVGLQIADLVAYPITRHVLNPCGVNLAYDRVEAKIFRLGDKVHGMKIFPSR